MEERGWEGEKLPIGRIINAVVWKNHQRKMQIEKEIASRSVITIN